MNRLLSTLSVAFLAVTMLGCQGSVRWDKDSGTFVTVEADPGPPPPVVVAPPPPQPIYTSPQPVYVEPGYRDEPGYAVVPAPVPVTPVYPVNPGYGGGPRQGVLEFGHYKVKKNNDVAIRLPERLYIEAVEVTWTDHSGGARGAVSIDDERWNVRGQQDIESPSTLVFTVEREGSVVHLHSAGDKSEVLGVRVYTGRGGRRGGGRYN